jgi:hypothetical protein
MRTKNVTQIPDEEKKELDTLEAGSIEETETEILRKRISELEKLVGKKTKKQIDVSEKKEELTLETYIPVVSLIPHRLNLSTREAGQGDIKKFLKYGEVKNILYKDLVDIMEVNRNFMEAGYFYILNPDVIRKHGLDEIYSKILTKEKIDEIVNNTNSEHCIELYKSANKEQQKIIVELFIEKIKENPDSVNLNTVDTISRISKINIIGKAEDSKLLAEELASENER